MVPALPRRLALAASLLFLLTPSARAEYVTAKLTGTSLGTIISPGSNVMINDGKGGTTFSAYKPGEVNWTNLTVGPSSLGSHFVTFCIELTQDVNPSTAYTFGLTALENAPKPGSPETGGSAGMGSVKADEMRELWGGYFNTIGSDGVRAAAFQLAIWKIEYDWGGASYNDLSKGNFRASDSAGAVALAQTWLTSLTTNSFTPATNLIALSDGLHQDQITWVTPAPPSLVLAGIGGAALGLCAWRRRVPVG